jgi:hypothetical protein
MEMQQPAARLAASRCSKRGQPRKQERFRARSDPLPRSREAFAQRELPAPRVATSGKAAEG